MSEEKGYNGWTNYETWNVKLWIDNDQGDQEFWSEQAQEAYDGAEADEPFTREERAALNLKDRLKDVFEENTPTVTGCYADLLNSALLEVNWYEIAQSLIEDNVEKEDIKEV